MRAPSASTDSLKLLLSGRADASIVDIHDLGLARERGEDVVGVGAIVQRPLAAVIAGPGVRRPRDLEGKRVGVTGLPSDDAVLRAVVESDGGDFGAVRRTTIGFSAVPSLVAGKVDAVVTFWNAEGVALRERGVRTREFRVDEFGAPRYPELVVAVTRETLRERPRAGRRPGGRAGRRDRGGAGRPRAPPCARSRASRAATSRWWRRSSRRWRRRCAPPLELDVAQLRRWARFDERFGILERRPDVARAFAASLSADAEALAQPHQPAVLQPHRHPRPVHVARALVAVAVHAAERRAAVGEQLGAGADAGALHQPPVGATRR